MKLYIKEIISRTVDGEKLITIKTYKTRPKFYHYIVWM